MTRAIVLLGSTGSVGTQTLDVVTQHPDQFRIAGIAAGGSRPAQIIEQATTLGLSAEEVAVADPAAARIVGEALGGTVRSGEHSAAELVRATPADTVLNALVGSLGIHATLATMETGRRLALANKESLVAGGTLVTGLAAPGQIVPVDSEHSAMAQCMRAGRAEEVDHFVLTASGGPFRGWTRAQLDTATPEQAGAHPTWSMGPMNTLNSATLINKGLELIEATLLFDLHPDQVAVTVHPQSIIHSMVTFIDGATMAMASPPSMHLPIAVALGWPQRLDEICPPLDFTQSFSWDFAPVDNDVFPAVELARESVRRGGLTPALYNAANENAAAAFLEGRITLPQIVDSVADVLDQLDGYTAPPRDIADVLAAEAAARAAADARIAHYAR